MTFDEVLDQVRTLLESQGRVSYRGLKRRFDLDDEYLEDLKEELLYAHGQSVEDDGRGLIWKGDGKATPTAIAGNRGVIWGISG